jgi:hypothetical protein
MDHRALGLAIVWVVAGSVLGETSLASAQAIRAVVLPKETREGQLVNDSGLEAVATNVLQQHGIRVLDLDASLRAQRFALSDSVAAGKLPAELTVLNADALASLQLRCSKSSEGVMATKILAFDCALDTKVIRVDTGEVIFANSESLTGHGLNAQMAVQSVLGKQLPDALRGGASRWAAAFTTAASWELELVVTRISDRQTARGLAERIGKLPGVSGARLVVFNAGLAKYAVAGAGQAELEGFATAIDDDRSLALTLTYESSRMLHAEHDFKKAFSRPVMAMTVVPSGEGLDVLGPEATRAALMNLPYFEMAHSQPVLSSPANARALEDKLRKRAEALKVPLVFAASLSHGDKQWSSAFKLIEVASGRTVAAATGSGPGSAEALDAVTRKFDEQYRSALGDAATRQRLGIQEAGTGASTQLVINAFKLPQPRDGGRESRALRGTLELRNASANRIEDAVLQLSSGADKVLSQPVPPIEPGASIELPVELNGVAPAEGDYVRVTAEVTYKVGPSYERVAAVAPLMRPVKHARKPAAVKGDSTLSPQYVEVLAVAVKQHADGEWEEAFKTFQRAHELSPNARTLRALGMVAFDLRNYDNATRYLGQALANKERALDNSMREQVTKLRAQAERMAKAQGVAVSRI